MRDRARQKCIFYFILDSEKCISGSVSHIVGLLKYLLKNEMWRGHSSAVSLALNQTQRLLGVEGKWTAKANPMNSTTDCSQSIFHWLSFNILILSLDNNEKRNNVQVTIPEQSWVQKKIKQRKCSSSRFFVFCFGFWFFVFFLSPDSMIQTEWQNAMLHPEL